MRTGRIIGAALVLCILAAAAVPAWAEEGTAPCFRLAAGETYGLAISTRVVTEQTTEGVVVSREQTVTARFTVNVLSIADPEAAAVRIDCVGIELHRRTPWGELSYDSAAPGKVPASLSDYTGMAGLEREARLLPTGRITAADAEEDEEARRMVEDAEENGGETAATDELFARLFGGGKKSGLDLVPLEQALCIYPEEPSESDRGWSHQMTLPFLKPALPLTVQVEPRADAGSMLDLQAEIKWSVRHEYDLDDEAQAILAGMTANLDLTGKMQGWLEVSKETGWPVQGRYSLRVAGLTERAGRSTPVALVVEVDITSFAPTPTPVEGGNGDA